MDTTIEFTLNLFVMLLFISCLEAWKSIYKRKTESWVKRDDEIRVKVGPPFLSGENGVIGSGSCNVKQRDLSKKSPSPPTKIPKKKKKKLH